MTRSSFIVFVALISFCVTRASDDKPCKIAYRCSTEPDPVWTTDGKSCIVLRNKCFLLSRNCHLQNSHETELKEIPKEECQKLCADCHEDDSPVCGYYDDEVKRTFANQCEMDKYICNTGETYGLFKTGPCA